MDSDALTHEIVQSKDAAKDQPEVEQVGVGGIPFPTVPGTTPRDANMDQMFPAIGEHGRDVLTELGLNSEAIDGLVAKGAVHLPD